jgi:hypothetical protein
MTGKYFLLREDGLEAYELTCEHRRRTSPV